MNDVIARLAAANPVPTEVGRRPLRLRWAALVLAAAAVLVPAALAVAAEIGVSNGGTTVPTSAAPLDRVLRELNAGSTMQFLGTLNGVGFYAGHDGAGHFCLAIEHVGQQYEQGAGCDWRPGGFPSTTVRAFEFPPARQLEGVAADGVARVEALDASGRVLDSTPVVDNLFASSVPLNGGATAIRTLDASGSVLTTQQLTL